MKSKVLFLNHINPLVKSGGSFSEQLDLKRLKKQYDVEVVGVYRDTKNSFITKISRFLFSPVPIIYSKKEVKRIKKIIKNSKANLIFIENSLLGYFAKYAKKNNKKVIVNFHNAEVNFSSGNVIKKILIKTYI